MASDSLPATFGPLATAVRIDCRRPASWIALAAAGGVGWMLAASGGRPGRVAVAVAAGGLLAGAAVGRLPTGVPGGTRHPWRRLAWLRCGWAAAGFLLAGIAGAWGGTTAAGPTSCGFPVVAGAAVVATAALLARPPVPTLTQAGTLGVALATAGVAAAGAATAATVGAGQVAQGVAAVAAWGLMVGGLASARPPGGRDWLGGPTAADPGLGIAMATSLAAMVGFFFLAPQHAWAYTALAGGWLVCLAVPPATEVTTSPATRRLVRSAPGRPRAPGSLTRTLVLVGQTAAVLVWPAVVAAVLPAAGVRPVGGGPVEAVAWLAAGAALILVSAAVAGRHGESARAVLLALTAAAVVVVSR